MHTNNETNQTGDNSVRLVIGDWASLQNDARSVREAVFIEEQNVPPEIEMDAMDAYCLHAVAYGQDGEVLGTGRLLPDGHIGRMAVHAKARGRGIGGMILRALMAQAQQRGDGRVVLNAQTQAAAFYQSHGFAQSGGEFQEAGIAHIEMELVFGEKGKA